MNTLKLRFFIVLSLLALFNYFFWQEKAGINLLIFNSLLILSLVYLSKQRFTTKYLKIALAMTAITGIMLVVYNSRISFLVHFASFIMLVGFLHRSRLSTIGGALWQSGLNGLFTTFEQFKLLSKTINHVTESNKQLKQSYKVVKLLVIPTLIFFTFVIIFKFANPIFGEILDTSFSNFFQGIESIFQNFSFVRIWFLAIGMFFILSVLFSWEKVNSFHRLVPKADIVQAPDQLNIPNLRTEYKTALILICAVNILLFIINTIDIRFLWFSIGHDLKSANQLSKLVHQGTYLLILSILLSIATLLYYFRKDLNFFTNNRWLVISSHIWIIQNGILVISVLLRNYEYITTYGLTHKRIGVAVFLLLTSIGLVMMWLKIKYLYSFFNLFKKTSWAWYFVLVSLTLFDWDSIIARYNLATQTTANLDYKYLYSLSERTLPILYENKEKIADRIKQIPDINHENEINKLYKKIHRYLAEQEGYTWVSWDISTSKAVNYFKNNPIPTATPLTQHK